MTTHPNRSRSAKFAVVTVGTQSVEVQYFRLIRSEHGTKSVAMPLADWPMSPDEIGAAAGAALRERGIDPATARRDAAVAAISKLREMESDTFIRQSYRSKSAADKRAYHEAG